MNAAKSNLTAESKAKKKAPKKAKAMPQIDMQQLKLDANGQSGQANSVHWTFWLGVSFFVAVILAISYAAYVLTNKMRSEEAVPVTSIVIAGEMPYTQRQDVLAVMAEINLSNFFNLDVNQVQQQVSELPWVHSVSVRKRWPDEVKIYVVDQVPLARWNGDFFINAQGKAFQAQAERVNHRLPALFGPEGSEVEALENYNNFSELLSYKDLLIEELVLTERYSWQILLNDGVRLNLGREERVERIQRFMDVYSQIKEKTKENANKNKEVDYIDLRYDTGLAVGWKSKAQEKRA